MRTARRVIVFLLLLSVAAWIPAQQAAAPAGGSADTDVTVVGRDDSIIPLPEPEDGGEIALPPLDPGQADPVLVPAVLPPLDDPSLLPPTDAAGGSPDRSAAK